MIGIIPKTDDKRSYLINSNDIIFVRTNNIIDEHKTRFARERRVDPIGPFENVYDWLIEVVCHKDLIITLTYEDIVQRDLVFKGIFKYLEHKDAIKYDLIIDNKSSFSDEALGLSLDYDERIHDLYTTDSDDDHRLIDLGRKARKETE